MVSKSGSIVVVSGRRKTSPTRPLLEGMLSPKVFLVLALPAMEGLLLHAEMARIIIIRDDV